MNPPTADELARKSCAACEGGVEPLSAEESRALLSTLPDWSLVAEGQRIRREWTARNFQAGVDFFVEIARLADQEGHHPDLHLEGYRQVAVELWTHAIGGLSENDFIMAAKIDRLPIQVRGGKPKA